MSELDEFIDILNQPSVVPSPALVEKLRREYPFFALPAAIMLQRGGSMLEPQQADRLRALVALNSNDPMMLHRLTTQQGSEFADFYGEAETRQAQQPDTDAAIDTFLDRYGTPADPAETAALEKLIFNPVPDYATQLAADEEAPEPADDSPAAIGSLLADISGMSAPPKAAPAPITASSDTTFSESLAKIYIRQHKYDKALEIISNLRLKFPEKSCYFADQMRFLQKLILNNSYN